MHVCVNVRACVSVCLSAAVSVCEYEFVSLRDCECVCVGSKAVLPECRHHFRATGQGAEGRLPLGAWAISPAPPTANLPAPQSASCPPSEARPLGTQTRPLSLIFSLNKDNFCFKKW